MDIVEKIKAEIQKRLEKLETQKKTYEEYELWGEVPELRGEISMGKYILKLLDSVCEDNVPEYSYNETIYHVGKKPKWSVGDQLAYYMFTSDEEGEIDLGTITNVEMGDDDWVYTFDDNIKDEYTECELIYSEAYRKNKLHQKKI